MKKTSVIVLLVLIITGLFVACNGDAANSVFGEEELPNFFGFTAKAANSSVTLEKKEVSGGETLADICLLYSTDGKVWNDYKIGTEITMTNVDDKVYFKAKEVITKLNAFNSAYSFSSKGEVEVKGNIMYLLNSAGETTEMPEYAFGNLFKGNTSLVSAKELLLPAETLSFGCYCRMFENCTSLTDTPELNATVLSDACYYEMFRDCTSLIDTPELNATVLSGACYNAMFSGCKSLTEAPDLLATNLVKDCYNRMFYGCSSLAIAPVFDATVKNNLKTESFVKTNALEIFKETKIPQSDFNAKCFAQ